MSNCDYDAIVVGSGMGGGAAGLELAKSGMRILFLEKGFDPKHLSSEFAGNYPEHFIHAHGLNREDVFNRSSRTTLKVNNHIPVLGAGLGGSSAVYGAGLLRFSPKDFETWPFRYEHLKTYYDQCDDLFQPKGTQDPLGKDQRKLNSPFRLCGVQQEIRDHLVANGLHPYRVPIAIPEDVDCQKCVGYFCPKRCKKTAGNVFVEPAIETFGAEIIYRAEVLKLGMDGRRCTSVYVKIDGELKVYHTKFVFLAAGALVTPVILMNSTSELFPDGIGNSHDVVGRYLMRHFIDFYYVQTSSKDGIENKIMEIGCSDFYESSEPPLGIIQSGGQLMPPEVMSKEFVARSMSWLPKSLKRVVGFSIAKILKKFIFERALVVAIMEDEARWENRILPNSKHDNLRMNYKIGERDAQRITTFRKRLKSLFKPMNVRLLKVAEDNSFLAHCCGTCRMGRSEVDSVVNENGLVHGCDNIYVVDASIFRTSSAVNPSLTIAACAMKIAAEFVHNQSKLAKEIGSDGESALPRLT